MQDTSGLHVPPPLRPMLTLLALVGPPLLALAVIEAFKPDPDLRPSNATATAPSADAPREHRPRLTPGLVRHGVACSRIETDQTHVSPGAVVELRAIFESPSSGGRRFEWQSEGGTFSALGSSETHVALTGYVYLDTFDDGVVDPQLWRADDENEGSVEERAGRLVLSVPGGEPDRGARLLLVPEVDGNFATQITVEGISVDRALGTAVLAFDTTDEVQSHLQVMARPTRADVEGNTRLAGGAWQQSVTMPWGESPVPLRLVRGRSAVRFEAGPRRLNDDWQPSSEQDAQIAIEAWSLEDGPRVEATFDSFGIAQNTIVEFRVSESSAPGAVTVEVADCSVTLTIERGDAG